MIAINDFVPQLTAKVCTICGHDRRDALRKFYENVLQKWRGRAARAAETWRDDGREISFQNTFGNEKKCVTVLTPLRASEDSHRFLLFTAKLRF